MGNVQEFCRALSELHDKAPVHSWQFTRMEIERAFGRRVEDLFVSIETTPLASGSIAQVSGACTLSLYLCAQVQVLDDSYVCLPAVLLSLCCFCFYLFACLLIF
jgi:hypothetical protein